MTLRPLREVRLVLPMEPNREVEAGETASALAASVAMDPDRADELRMAVHEACINAFEHSQAGDRNVYVSFTLLGDETPRRIQVEVRDRGVGFSPPRVGDTIEPAGRPRKRGWGLTIIRRLMDGVEIASGVDGTVITMFKDIGVSGNAEGAGA